ncbi:MAG: hypothetical protein HY092_02180 [Candidatus Kerfeldbacteria bacterium]|nr:hypothetical protein [Candidatus Kerfeldbacteria bacterium]
MTMGLFSPRFTGFSRPSSSGMNRSLRSHRSFRLSKPAKVTFTPSIKKEVERKSFGRYVPKQDRKTLEELSKKALHHPGEIKDKDIAYYGRQRKSEYQIGTRQEKERFVRGMFKEAHEEHLRLKGFHPAGREYQEAQGVVSRIDKEHTPPPPPPVQEPRSIDIVRERLGIQHGPPTMTKTLSQTPASPTPTPGDENGPPHTPSDHPAPPTEQSAHHGAPGGWQNVTSGFGPVRPHQEDQTAVGPGVPVVHHDVPPAPGEPKSEPVIPDTSQVDRDLPL